MRRPFNSTKVLPTPSERRLTELTSPRAALEVCGLLALEKSTSPIWGMERSRSSPLTAPVATISSCVTTVTGRAAVVEAPRICEPTTTMSSTWVVWASSSVDDGWGAVCCAAAAVEIISTAEAAPAIRANLDWVFMVSSSRAVVMSAVPSPVVCRPRAFSLWRGPDRLPVRPPDRVRRRSVGGVRSAQRPGRRDPAPSPSGPPRWSPRRCR